MKSKIALFALLAFAAAASASVPDVGGPTPFPVQPSPASVPDVGGPGSWWG